MVNLFTPEVEEIVLSVMEGLSCPRSLTAAILVRYGLYEELMKLEPIVTDYCDAEDYFRAAQASKFLAKLECRIPGLDPEAVAVEKWWAAERQCFTTNRRLNTLIDFGGASPDDQRFLAFLSRVRKNVSKLIGDAPPEVMDGVFGPGATVTDKSTRSTIAHKLSLTPSLTHGAWAYLIPWTGTKWAVANTTFCEQNPLFVPGNQYFQVPKNALTNRSCAKEPSLNAFYQRGYGEVMARRLAHHGIHIKPDCYGGEAAMFNIHRPSGQSAKDVHMQVACRASLSGSFSTIDLSSASDTVCTALVRSVLPASWYECLNQLRSPKTLIKGRWVVLEKFSSMGNGFTFELETTLFLAIAMAVRPELIPGVNLWVFGDDIIVPTDATRDVCAALQYSGFTLNPSKSFTAGAFRESCGGDFWMGESVRPYSLKELPHEPQDFIALANGIRRMAHQNSYADRLWGGLRRSWFRCLDCIPSNVRVCRGPADLGDLVITDDEKYWKYRNRANGIRYLRVYRPVGRPKVAFSRFSAEVQFASALYGVAFIESGLPQKRRRPLPEGLDTRHIPLRGDVAGYKVGWVPYS